MKSKTMLGINIEKQSKITVLEKIVKYIRHRHGFVHIISLNPENIVIAQKDKTFKKVINTSKLTIVDGVGIVIAGRILNIDVGERITGVELMQIMIKEVDRLCLSVLLIGGRPSLAERLAKCYRKNHTCGQFFGLEGIKNINKPQEDEEDKIASIVADRKPNIVFVAFGSPHQELWIERHKKQFQNCVCIGVGGAFDYLSNNIKQPPVFVRNLGLEWFFRLFKQPWRWKRQLRLIKFMYLILKQKLS